MVFLGLLVVAAVGVAGIVLGEGDDSPGLQFLGFVVTAGAVVLGVRRVRSRRTAD